MKIVEANFDKWFIQCLPEDGGRISVLKYAGQDLLTTAPSGFKSPEKYAGEFETRPVYGYDDCFPTVDLCSYPVENTLGRDHGELCWKNWHVESSGSQITCQVYCNNPKVIFKRIMEFNNNRLTWKFEVLNLSDSDLAFLHVIHALMPLKKMQRIELPGFVGTLDEIKAVETGLKNSDEVINHLQTIQPGKYEMILLKGINAGFVNLGFQNGMDLQISFDNKLFPTLGIWWNNSGYPDEDGLQRNECAFEPIPGTSSDLSRSYKDGIYLRAKPGKTFSWDINWEINNRLS